MHVARALCRAWALRAHTHSHALSALRVQRAHSHSQTPLGVSAATLRLIARSLPDASLSTQQVVQALKSANKTTSVLSLTKDAQVAPATVRVVHSWTTNFHDLLETLLAFEAVHPNQYFWIDMLSPAPDSPSLIQTEQALADSSASILSTPKLLLVLSPWLKPAPLMRARCLWELVHSVALPEQESEPLPLTIMLPPYDREFMHDALLDDPAMILETLQATEVDISTSGAYSPQECHAIYNAVESRCGLDHANGILSQRIREFYLSEIDRIVDRAVQTEPDNKDLVATITQIAFYLLTARHYDLALGSYRRALTFATRLFGQESEEVATIHTELGLAYGKQGNNMEAITHFQLALPLLRKIFEGSHLSIATSSSHLAIAYSMVGRYEEAISMFQQAISIQSDLLDPIHLSIAGNYNNIGNWFEPLTVLSFFVGARRLVLFQLQSDGAACKSRGCLPKECRYLPPVAARAPRGCGSELAQLGASTTKRCRASRGCPKL
eukprot:m.272978 g.272978  ORF g.272978 m.272978 type:complete len:497 (-) comp54812_c0_seq1:2041-3531(-)